MGLSGLGLLVGVYVVAMTNEEKSHTRMVTPSEGNDSLTAMEEPAGSEPLIQQLPWHVRDDGDELASVIDENDFCVFTGVTLDEAHFIVRAVNSHEELVAALKAILEVLRVEAPGTPLNNQKYDGIGIQAYAALAKAEGR
jgi:hypothetical protein